MFKAPFFPRAMRPLALTALAIAVGGALTLPQTADASAFQLRENSAQAMGRAYAGLTTAGGDCSVVVNNPAAMSILTGGCFQADVTGINFSAKFTGTAHDALGRPISGGNGGDAGTTLPVPALFWSSQLGQKWHVGAGFTVPFGFQTKYDRDWKGRYSAIKSKFQSLDATGVGQLVKMGVKSGRKTREGMKIGICGEHGGDPASVMFCHRIGLNYVSCSPFRIPIAKLAAAQVALQEAK